MSIEAMNWALSQETGSSAAKAVLLILANRSDHDGVCWPGIDGIARQTELAKRTVVRAVKKLQECRLVSIEHRGGTGEGRKSNIYRLHIHRQSATVTHCDLPVKENGPNTPKCQSGTLAQSAIDDRQSATVSRQSATLTPEPKDNPKKNHQSRARATRIPDDFELTDKRRLVAEAETLPAERTFAKFFDYWRAESGAKARKHDWDATWRNWCRNQTDRFGGGRRAQQTSTDPYYEELRRATSADNA